MAVSPTDIRLEMEFATGVYTDIIGDVRADLPFSFKRGIWGSRPTDRMARIGKLRFCLDNSTSNSGGVQGYYSPGHGSCRSGFDIGINVRIAIDYGGSTYIKFFGQLNEVKPVPGQKGKQHVRCTATDFIYRMSKHPLDLLEVKTDRRSDLFFADIVNNMDVSPNTTNYLTGQETFAYAGDELKDEKTTALAAAQRNVMSEFGFAYENGGNYNDDALLDAAYLCRCEDSLDDELSRLTPTESGGIIYSSDSLYSDKYGSHAVQLAEATTNYTDDPQMGKADTTEWASGNASLAKGASVTPKIGSQILEVSPSDDDAYFYDDTHWNDHATIDGNTITISAWFYVPTGGTATSCGFDLYENTGGGTYRAAFARCAATYDAWQYLELTHTAASGLTSCQYRIECDSNNGGTVYVDACQFEYKAQATPYCDGSLGNGHSWTSTAHASTSSRTATSAAITKNTPSNYSIGFWFHPVATEDEYSADKIIFEWYGDANDYLKFFLDHSNDYVSVTHDGNGTTKTISASATQWTRHSYIHYCITYDGTTLTLYQDGSSVGTPQTGLSSFDTTPPTFYLGADNGDSNHINGLFDDIFILNYALSGTEVSALYNEGVQIKDNQEISGILTFEDRHTRLKNTTSQLTIDDDMVKLTGGRKIRNCFNYIKGIAYPREIGASAESMYTLQTTIEVGPNETETVIARYTDPSNRDIRVASEDLWDSEGKNEITDADDERGFESGTTGWTAAGDDSDAIARSATQAKVGAYSLKLTSGTGGANTNFAECGPYSGFAQNDIVYVQAYVYLEEAWPADVELCVAEHDSSHVIGTTTAVTTADKSTTGSWVRLSGTHTCVDADCDELKIQIGVVSAGADFSGGSVDVYIDEVYLIDDSNLNFEFSSSTGGGGDLNDNLVLIDTVQGGNSTKFLLENVGSSTGYVTSLIVKGIIIRLYEATIIIGEDSTSQSDYGRHDLSLVLPYQDAALAAKDFVDHTLSKWKDPQDIYDTITYIANRSGTYMTAACDLEIGDRITLSETVTGLSSIDFVIQGIEMQFIAGDTIKCTYSLAPGSTDQFWVLGTVGFSELEETTYLSF